MIRLAHAFTWLGMLAWSAIGYAQDEGAAGLDPAPAPQVETQTEPEAQTQTQQTQTQTQPAPDAPVFQEEPGPAGVPTPPPGYGTSPQPQPGYAPGVQPPQFQLRTPQLDPESAARIDALMRERDQIRVGGWIAMMAAGAATTAVSVLFAVAFADVERDETGCSRCGDNTGTITFSAISILTAAVAVTGFLMFLNRSKKRRAITRQIQDIRQNAIARQVALLEF